MRPPVGLIARTALGAGLVAAVAATLAIATAPAAVQQRLRIIAVNSVGTPHVHVVASPACTPLSLSVTHQGVRATAVPASNSLADLATPLSPDDQITVGCGSQVVSFAYDGLPSIGPTACGGSRSIAGDLTPGAFVLLALARPGVDVPYTRASQLASVVRQGAAYHGAFPHPLAASDVLRVDELLQGFVNGIYINYYSINERVAGACQSARPPTGSVRVLRRRHLLRTFLSRGLPTIVTDDEPGTVTEDLYLDNGARTPAQATRNRHPRLTLIGRVRANVVKPGSLSVIVRPIGAAKRLGSHRPLKTLLLATLRNVPGGSRTLPARRLILRP